MQLFDPSARIAVANDGQASLLVDQSLGELLCGAGSQGIVAASHIDLFRRGEAQRVNLRVAPSAGHLRLPGQVRTEAYDRPFVVPQIERSG